LYATLSGNPVLTEFGFITRWPSLTPEKQRELYSKYACHELNLFLAMKAPEFFDAVVRPYIANKLNKTFMDQWLLDADLSAYNDPWRYAQLNIAERVLLGQGGVGRRGQGVATPCQIARAITDQHDLIPPDIDRFNFLFKTALQGKSLDVLDGKAEHEALKALGYLSNQTTADIRLKRKAPARVNAPDLKSMPAPAKPGGKKDILSKVTEALVAADAPEEKPATELGVELKELAENEEFFDADEERRASVRQLYQTLDKTEELAENNYYHLPILAQNGNLIPVNGFWRDYAERDADAPFLSANLAEASGNLTEMLLALAVLDLPFEAGDRDISYDGDQCVIKAGSPMVVFHKALRETEPQDQATPILVSENFFRNDDRYTYDGNERIDKFISDEFLAQVVYGCQVAVTNPTSSRQKLDVLLQVPQGAVPVQGSKYKHNAYVEIEPYNTTTIEYFFYFPLPGDFGHYPVHVAKQDTLIAHAAPTTMKVVMTPTVADTTSWDYVSQNADLNGVVTFLETHNLLRLDLERIAWRMQDKRAFKTLLTQLKQRHVYNPTLWSYAIHHNDADAIREYLQNVNGIETLCGSYIDTPLLTIDPVLRKTYEHLEYSPLVNARTHKLGATYKIVNDRLAQQYQRLMTVLSYRPRLDSDDLLAITYYMLLQDRVEDALSFFARVERAKVDEQIQYDYVAAYVALYREDLELARTIAATYREYPVDRWRKRFNAIDSQLAEIETAAAPVVDDDTQPQRQTVLAATESSFELAIDAKQITVDYQNIGECRVNYYVMDVELLFSRSPFTREHSDHFSTIRPNFSEVVPLPQDGGSHTFGLPEQFHTSNVLVEVEANGVRKSQACYANNLVVHFIENYGQLKVTHRDTGNPLSTVYVKVFAQMKNGEIRFYKDGYTDLRGRFDYASLSTDELDAVEKFAILVLSEKDGATVREAKPPKK